MDLSNPILVPTSRPPGYNGGVPFSPNVLNAYAVYYRQQEVYGRPSEQYAVGLVRDLPTFVQEFHVDHPDWSPYSRPIIWLGDTGGKSRAPLGYDPALQRARTFGGVSAPYYQPVAAPSLDEVSRFMGGIVNG